MLQTQLGVGLRSVSKRAIFRDLLILPGLALLGVVVVLVGMGVAASLRETYLKSTGLASANNWLKNLDLDPAILLKTFEDRRLAIEPQHLFEHVGRFGQVFRMEFYDAEQHLFYSVGHGAWPTKSLEALGAPITSDPNAAPVSSLHEFSRPDGRHTYAAITMPYAYAGQPKGTMLLFVDQTQHAAELTKSFSIIAGVTALLLLGSLGACALVISLKIRQQWRAQDRINYLSHYDELTGLANRVTFTDELAKALEQRSARNDRIAVAYFDIDKFKDLNDSNGHSAGDALLHDFAARLKANLRKNDIAARADGDEFVVAFTGLKAGEEARTLVEALTEILSRPYLIHAEPVECTLSVGVVMAPDDGEDTASLLRFADLALVRAKKDSHNSICFFERGMDLTFQRRRERESDLKRALERDEFEVLYQPQVWLSDETLCGHEALVRWRHPVHGKISPAYFISIAEETELIVPLGEWILRRACQDAAKWPDESKIAVNLSPVQFKSTNIAELVRSILDETRLHPSRLELEITESLLMWDTETVLKELGRIRNLGVTIAMDDFGTGYSSLSYLSRFPFGKIKIDRSFVRCMHSDEAVSAIVSCIIGLGRSLDVTITAEGVETTQQADMLRALGCDQAQGFLYGRPADAKEALKRITDTARPVLSVSTTSAA